MKKYLLIVLFGILSGCATIHEQCMEDGERYGGYDRCLAEKYQERDNRRRALSGMFQSMGQGMQNNASSPSYQAPVYIPQRQQTCNTTMVGNYAQTNCY